MKLFLKIFIAALLLFNGIGAVYGGGSFILYPDGSGMQMPLSWLRHSPFTDYLLPGIILFTCNGVLSLFTLYMLLRNHKFAAGMVMVQGLVLTGWIICQVILLQVIYYLHFVLGSVGLALLLSGWMYNRVIKNLKTAK